MSKRDPVAGGATNANLKPSPAMMLLMTPVKVVNVGLKGFADELSAQGVPVQHVEWQPPASGDPKLAALLAKLGI
ncbi:MAG: hypothetical protein ABL898_07965 [Hyphomicrobiaceae bacterium]|nr:hypothetical protein [Hyphomicrobiaceae bacterium]